VVFQPAPARETPDQEGESLVSFWNRAGKSQPVEKASKAKTPPLARQKPVYGDKKIVKAVKPKPPKKGSK
jgi:hypothetical protein